MRPIRLELRGFTAFRDDTVIDFGDADYFALVGATGSGKSSVIDAICFALYGSVPRYDDVRLVAPVISQGQLEARVRFDFSLDGKVFTAVRVVRRVGRGATTKEARLECGSEVLAGNADELTVEVKRLLGLPFEHFTRCVVLPQGEFARFLHDKPSVRQELLVTLLHLDIYTEMGQHANQLSGQAKNKAALIQERLDNELAFATDEELAEASGRAERLRVLRSRVAAAQPQLRELDIAISAAEEAAARAERFERSLTTLGMPGEVEQLVDRMSHAAKLVDEAEASLEEAERAAAVAEGLRRTFPERDPLAGVLSAHGEKSRLEEEAGPERKRLDGFGAEEDAARQRLHVADVALRKAAEERDAAIHANAAHHVAATLVVGEACPVCLQVVDELPAHESVPDLDATKSAVNEAARARDEAQGALTDASEARAAAEARLATLDAEIARIDQTLDGQPDAVLVRAQLEAIDAAERAVREARATESLARATHKRAVADLELLRSGEGDARRDFETRRDALIALEPPPAERVDLVADWAALIRWARTRAPGLAAEAAAARRDAGAAAGERAALLEELEMGCRECGVALSDDDTSEAAVVAELTRAEGHVEHVKTALETGVQLRESMEALQKEHEVARTLGSHLSARGFEKWIINEALGRLVEGAGGILRELSGGAYSLAIDASNSFQVIDHHNADETRSAKTLSGGETFLASLSLALALADELAQLAAGGAARLETIFLDEGFGTLDPDTLATVAATVENLAAGGRMVGIVTHVRELADTVPVQFRVTKDARTAAVERVAV
jgi:DNA repair protein SbcC/Rad50